MTLIRAPYAERRAHLEALKLNGSCWQTPDAFDDPPALFEAICERSLEGIFAKRRSGRYQPGERGWAKIKKRDYWRYEIDRESAINKRRKCMFV
jgi:bifunctional non-homologous end joining protein LigD